MLVEVQEVTTVVVGSEGYDLDKMSKASRVSRQYQMPLLQTKILLDAITTAYKSRSNVNVQLLSWRYRLRGLKIFVRLKFHCAVV